MADALDTLMALVHAETNLLALVGDSFGAGKLSAEALGTYPRVIWISEGGSIGPPRWIGGRPNASTTTRNNQTHTDEMAVVWRIWGESRESTRAVMHALLGACRAQMIGAVEFGNYEWTTQQTEQGENSIHGQEIILSGVILLPVHEGAGDLTTIATQTHRGDFISPQDGSVITGICQT